MDGTELYTEGDHWKLFDMPSFVTREHFDPILTMLADAGAEDIFVSSDSPLCAKVNGRVHRLTDRYLGHEEVAQLLGEIHMESSPGRVASEDVDFTYTVAISEYKSWMFRCNATGIMGTRGSTSGIAMALRAGAGMPPTLDMLKVPQWLRDMLFPDNGIIIVTGPTGSGKTTLLAAIINHAATLPFGKHILSYESPPEFDYHAIPDQTGLVEVSQIGRGGHLLDYPKATRNSLRRNPDIIVYGEARDPETIEGAINASTTGHLVLTTAHTNQVAPTLSRMANVFSEGDRDKIVDALISNVRGVIHQRLVRTPDGKGRTPILEGLSIDAGMRERLYGTHLNELTSKIQGFVNESGYPLGKDLSAKYNQGRVSDEDCMRIAQELTHEP